MPSWLDYELWQGPAPEREYRDNLVHYNWHWFWHWGTGELGNNGIHALDVCRWGLEVDYPTRVTAGGGKYFFDDDQETPDTHVVTWDFGDKAITWEGRNWHHHGFEGSTFGIAFYGDKGSLVTDGHDYKIYDSGDKLLDTQAKGFVGHDPHLKNFLACVRSGERPAADIEEGHKSTLLCHLGNIAYRTGHTLNCDPANGHIQNDAAAEALWGREYRPGWEPQGLDSRRGSASAGGKSSLLHHEQSLRSRARRHRREKLPGLRFAGRAGGARDVAGARRRGGGRCAGRDGLLLSRSPAATWRTSTCSSGRWATGDLRHPVYPKDPQAPICACFGLTAEDVEADIREGGVTRVRALIEKAKRPGGPLLDRSRQAAARASATCSAYYMKLRGGS